MMMMSKWFRKKPTNNNKQEEEDAVEFDYACCGVSLAHLASLPVDPSASFGGACDFIKSKTASLGETSNRSYARFLRSNPKTKHLVREKATVFVSYAWLGGFGQTMKALTEHFAGKLEGTFVWMDFAVVDQHKAATSNIEFDTWAETFKSSLVKIGQAVLVLTPGEEPIAISRSWCCFEWTMIVESTIQFTYCVPKADEERLIQRIYNAEMGHSAFHTLFSGINVETAKAAKDSDRESILKLMREIGVVKVNDIVMRSLKEWLVRVVVKAEDRADDGTTEMRSTLNSRGSLHQALGEINMALPFFERAIECARQIPNNEEDVAASLNNLGSLLYDKGDVEAAERLLREAVSIARRVMGEEHPFVAQELSNLGSMLCAKGDLEGAEPIMREVILLKTKALGGDHPSVATSLNNLAVMLKRKRDLDGAEPLYREALAIRKKALGENHPDVAQSLNNLAMLIEVKGDLINAEPLYREALSIKKKVLGEDHPDVATSLNNLAGLLRDLNDGRNEEAKQLGVQAYNICLRALGPENEDTQNYEYWTSFE